MSDQLTYTKHKKVHKKRLTEHYRSSNTNGSFIV